MEAPQGKPHWRVHRAAWPAEARPVASLMARVFKVPLLEELQDTLQCSGALLATGGAGRALVGALTYTFLPANDAVSGGAAVHINSVATDPQLQRRGIGDALLRDYLERFGSTHDTTLSIDVARDAGLRAFYARHGFKFSGRLNPRWNEIWERPRSMVQTPVQSD